MYDDFVEIDPGAALELETALQARYIPTPYSKTAVVEKKNQGLKEEFLHLLVCTRDKTGRKCLTQETLRDINDDRALFRHLHKRYFFSRSWFTLRGIKSLRLAKVQSQDSIFPA